MELQEIVAKLTNQEEKVDRTVKELELLRQISTDNLMAVLELRKYHEGLSREFKEFKDEMRAFKDEVKAFMRGVEEFKDEMRVFKDEMKEFKDEMRAFKDEMRAFKDEMKAFKDEMNKRWGDLANRLGTLAEDIFGPGIPYLLKTLGYEVKSVLFDLETGPKGKKRQYDVLIFAEKDGQETVWVAEVKNQAKPEDFEQMKEALELLPELFPPVAGLKIIPVLAAFRFPEGMINAANKRKILLVRMGGEYLEPLNPEVVSH
ncbi:hypothetical protein Thein_0971 [Thermodesulfatator indicus DSM 15286]|uniref:DUF8196 domain-containing protein n=1 Tax=Thermodesulfatator indicus (strain DSM 15286 / JCM 11887 / CIR29812) TaxID=667014 RepID=F8A8Q6_THEID|nr:hypothetical protein [Thermodesulfatator indicus]AEH44843.1 hypothetical protein Thein_0971 [Thermodesulfatator indicus DSM 15286]